ncbi:MAG: glucose-6-phosphate isomerase [Polyangiales bacterium]
MTEPMDLRARWERYRSELCAVPAIGLTLDVSRMGHDEAFLASMKAPMERAFAAMEALEKGAIANPDEKRQVGHYWLRDPDLAPDGKINREIVTTVGRCKSIATLIHRGDLAGSTGAKFTDAIIVGIGGSALGPQLASRALASAHAPIQLHFFDNTDPMGFDDVLARLGDRLESTLVVVISKSGGTKETRNGMLAAKTAMEGAGLTFAKHAFAITGEGSLLDEVAVDEQWLGRLPMWDWVGGRTSELSAVGLFPAALQGVDIEAMLAGARDCDVATRVRDLRKNPAALLAAVWYFAGEGRGRKDMVVLPYKDRLELFSRYLQQLVMESLGKEKDLAGAVVHQGIAVYGNKGSTDQHAYVQQLRDGVRNFFVTFIEVLRDTADAPGEHAPVEVEPGVTSGDYLLGFMLGTRRALYESGRPSLTITLDEVSPRSLGVLIALFERAVGLYASLVNVNAYHQPGVEAGKKAAADVLALQSKLVAALGAAIRPMSATELAASLGTDDVETVFKLCEHLAANRRLVRGDATNAWEAQFSRG